MKIVFTIFLLLGVLCIICHNDAIAQCSICTKTAQQLGEGPASGMNSGIIYLAFIPLLIFGYIGFRWWRSEKTNRS